jgi:hypothetical protein
VGENTKMARRTRVATFVCFQAMPLAGWLPGGCAAPTRDSCVHSAQRPLVCCVKCVSIGVLSSEAPQLGPVRGPWCGDEEPARLTPVAVTAREGTVPA